jgi:hypothetical protein
MRTYYATNREHLLNYNNYLHKLKREKRTLIKPVGRPKKQKQNEIENVLLSV